MTLAIVVVLLLGAVVGFIYLSSAQGGNVLTADLSEPLGGAKTAKIDINSDTGHLTIDKLTGGEQLLAGGTLQYFEKQGVPARTRISNGDQASLTLKGGGSEQSWLRLPWSACGGAYEWQIHLNPSVAADLTAYTGGGNVKLDLAGMALTRLSAETDGGNVAVTLPDNAASLSALAKTGGGNVAVEVGNGTTGSNTLKAESGAGDVTVKVPSGLAIKVHATSGLGKVIVDSRFSQTDANTYQTSDYESAANRLDINASSGAGNVNVSTK